MSKKKCVNYILDNLHTLRFDDYWIQNISNSTKLDPTVCLMLVKLLLHPYCIIKYSMRERSAIGRSIQILLNLKLVRCNYDNRSRYTDVAYLKCSLTYVGRLYANYIFKHPLRLYIESVLTNALTIIVPYLLVLGFLLNMASQFGITLNISEPNIFVTLWIPIIFLHLLMMGVTWDQHREIGHRIVFHNPKLSKCRFLEFCYKHRIVLKSMPISYIMMTSNRYLF